MRTTETDIRTMAFTLSSTWMCLCFLSLLALLLSLSLCQPFGIHRLSLHKWCPLSELDKALAQIARWLFEKRQNANEGKGNAETLTVHGQSGLTTTGSLGRSGASSARNGESRPEIKRRAPECCESRLNDGNTKDLHPQRPGERRSPQTGIAARAERGSSTIGGGRPTLRCSCRGRRRRVEHRQHGGGKYLRCFRLTPMSMFLRKRREKATERV
jgi:hypothetical protein